ncbi:MULTISPECIES: c-type cytochrome [Sphingomonas]|jgi:cytochrome c|uniref:c-type cytochrome n=1 Tax=Sphingomonas TaxID=13687 RepID=UPI0020C060AF|nr:c-type cytochrome [Sphingomonas faeni]MCK8456340.1 c-type cytochrome [Sphingomonas faeni]
MKAAGWVLLALALAGCGSGPDAASDRIADGKRVFRRCTACHTIGQYATDTDGPNLYGVMGGPVGERRTRFSYTAGLKALGGTWDAERMDRWLANPRRMVPGTTMGFAGLSDPKDRADVIAYLSTQGP